MAENIKDFRLTTISLDEYNSLKDQVTTLRERVGSKDAQVDLLHSKIQELQEQQPLVKVVHYREKYDDWDDSFIQAQDSIQFMNLGEVTELAKKEANAKVEARIKELENKLEQEENNVKQVTKVRKAEVDNMREEIDTLRKQMKKAEKESLSMLKEKEEEYVENLKASEKAYNKDVAAYKETINDLKQEIKNIKEDKTQLDIEKKRNEEIKTLKGRIADLEKILNDLKNTSFLKRLTKLRHIELEQNKAEQELVERRRKVDNIGTSWVVEGNKVRKYDHFKDLLGRQMNNIYRYGHNVLNYITLSNGTRYTWRYY